MTKTIAVLAAVVVAIAFTGPADAASKNVRVKGHTTKSGSYVPAHTRTAPNKSKSDNWSTKGNVNPYTGKKGSKDPGRK